VEGDAESSRDLGNFEAAICPFTVTRLRRWIESVFTGSLVKSVRYIDAADVAASEPAEVADANCRAGSDRRRDFGR